MSDPLPPHVAERYVPLDGDAVRMVRPYVDAVERQAEQRLQAERRLALQLAELGIDYPEPLRGAPAAA